MRKLILAAGLLAGMTTLAAAQTATQQDVSITASVAKFCTVGWTSASGGTGSPSAITPVQIPVSANGVVTTDAITHTVNGAVCNTAADVVAKSLSGGVKSSTVPATNFTNIIDYTGSATFGGVTSSINTADAPAAAGPETGTAASTTGAVSGSLLISITPAQPAKPLMPATDYADTLQITITPK